MAKKKTADDLPNLSNATPEFLVDELGAVRDEIKVLNQLEGLYKDALKARMDGTTVEGEKYAGLVSETSQMRLDSESVKKEMGEEWWAEHCKEITFTVVKTTKKVAQE